MKKILMISLLLGSFISQTGIYAKTNEQPLDKMIAIVNDDVITRSELNHALETAKMQMAQEHAATPPIAVLQKQVLNQLINKKIQLQIAQQAGVTVPDKELNAAIAQIAERNHMTIDELYERLSTDGMAKDDYRNQLRDQLVLQKLQQHEVASKLTVTPQEVTNFINSHAWQKNSDKEYHLQDMLIPLAEAPTVDEIVQAKNHADDLAAKIRQGQSFEQIAMAESPDGKSLQGGDLGWRKLPEIPGAFAEEVVRMQPHTIAGPIQTPNGFHIIHLVESRTLNAKQAADSRKMIEMQLLEQKFEEALQTWVSKLRGQSFVVINT